MTFEEWFLSTGKSAHIREDLRLAWNAAVPPSLTPQTEKRFPILQGKTIKSIPWAMLIPHEEQAQRNHYQSLKQLASRGGLSACEAMAVLEDRKWAEMSNAEMLLEQREKAWAIAAAPPAQAPQAIWFPDSSASDADPEIRKAAVAQAPQQAMPCGNREYCSRFPFCGCGGPDPLPERNQSKPAEQQGLFRKFVVTRTDGSDKAGGKHFGCEYFVLDVTHDTHAKAALAAYAADVAKTHPLLAADMRERYELPQGEAQASPAAARIRVPEITPAMVTQAAERAGFSPVLGKLTLFVGVLQVLLDRAAIEAAIKAPAAEPPFRLCEFCGCNTNARQRFCCDKGMDADRAAEPARQEGEALEEMRARKDAAYLERNQVVAALAKRFPSGVARTAIEGWSEDWHGCVFIDLPTGQASWHFHDSHAHLFAGLPPYKGTWDGHDTPEKYRRLAALASPPPAAAGAQPASNIQGNYDAHLTEFLQRFERNIEKRNAVANEEMAKQAGAQPVAWIRPDVLPWVHHPARFGNPGTEVIMYKSRSRDATVPVYAAAPQTVPIDAQAAQIAGALFDFGGMLTSREEVLTCSTAHDASPMVKAIEAFAAKRGLSLAAADVTNWNAARAAGKDQP